MVRGEEFENGIDSFMVRWFDCYTNYVTIKHFIN